MRNELMYINDVVHEVRRVLPGEYTTYELYRWCDELSAELRRNFKKVYKRERVKSTGGCFILPEDIDESCIYSVIADGQEIMGQDMRRFGYTVEYTSDGPALVCTERGGTGTVEVVYLVPHTPLRIVDKTVQATPLDSQDAVNRLRLAVPLDIISGDTLTLKTADTEYIVNVCEMEYDGESQVIGFLEDVPIDGEVRIIRHIVEKTVCPSPYDSMYIDFCTAKISWYQRNFSVYSYMKKSFDEKLSEYGKFIRRTSGKEPVSKLINFI